VQRVGAGRAQPQLHHYEQHQSSDARSIQAFSACTARSEVAQKVKNQILTSPASLSLSRLKQLILYTARSPKSPCCIPRGGPFRATVIYSLAFEPLVCIPSALRFVFINTMPYIPLLHYDLFCQLFIESSYPSTLCRSLQNKREN